MSGTQHSYQHQQENLPRSYIYDPCMKSEVNGTCLISIHIKKLNVDNLQLVKGGAKPRSIIFHVQPQEISICIKQSRDHLKYLKEPISLGFRWEKITC